MQKKINKEVTTKIDKQQRLREKTIKKADKRKRKTK